MRILLPALCALILTACGGGEAATCDQREPFQAARQGSPLAVPEDLAKPSPSGKFDIPEAGRDKPVRGPCGDVPPLRLAQTEPAAPAEPAPADDADLPAPPTNEVPGAEGEAAAAVADTVAPPAPTAGPPALTGSIQEDVRATLIAWLTALRNGDGDAVVSFYSKDYEPPVAGQSREEWAAKRIASLTEIGPTDVRGDRLSVDESYAGASARFIQELHNNGQIDAVIKRLDFVVEDGRWMIVSERILEVL